MSTIHTLTKKTGHHTTFCQFSVKDGGVVRVMAYATHTNYTSDVTVTAEEARNVWRAKRAEGFALSA